MRYLAIAAMAMAAAGCQATGFGNRTANGEEMRSIAPHEPRDPRGARQAYQGIDAELDDVPEVEPEFGLFAANDNGSDDIDPMDPQLMAFLDPIRTPGGAPAEEETLVKIISVPAGARIYMDDEPVGVTGDYMAVPPGRIEFEVNAPGYEPRTVRLDVKMHEHRVRRVKLKRTAAD